MCFFAFLWKNCGYRIVYMEAIGSHCCQLNPITRVPGPKSCIRPLWTLNAGLREELPWGGYLAAVLQRGLSDVGSSCKSRLGTPEEQVRGKTAKVFFFLILPLQSLVKFYVFKGVKTNSLNVHTLSLPPLCSLFCTEQPGPSSSRVLLCYSHLASAPTASSFLWGHPSSVYSFGHGAPIWPPSPRLADSGPNGATAGGVSQVA